jgi:hypothetical protein
MADDHIATYLNDHLAGSVVALELLERLEAAHQGAPLESFIAELRTDVEADRKELESLMSALQISESRTRKASAWIAEKFTELKLRFDDPAADGDLRLLESIEAVALGIDGKRALWRSLAAAAAAGAPKLQMLDYERLEHRAEEQRSRIEAVRLDAAKKALVPVS